MERYLYRLVTAMLIAFAAGCATADRTVRVSGDDAVVSGFILPVKETFEEENGIPLTIVRSKPGEELVDLDRGIVDVVIAPLPLQDLLADAALKRVVIDPADLHQVEVGINDMVIFLHGKNKIRKLTKKQLKGIFSGKISNWRQLGGADRGITVVWDASSPAENELFTKKILDGAPIIAKIETVGDYEAVRKRVSTTPGSIGIAPRGFIVKGVKVPKSPLVSSRVIIVTKGESSPHVKNLIELLKAAEYIQ